MRGGLSSVQRFPVPAVCRHDTASDSETPLDTWHRLVDLALLIAQAVSIAAPDVLPFEQDWQRNNVAG